MTPTQRLAAIAKVLDKISDGDRSLASLCGLCHHVHGEEACRYEHRDSGYDWPCGCMRGAALPPSGALGLARELESEVAEPTDEELLEREREAAICGFKTASADGKDADEAARYAMTCGRRFLFHHGRAFERGSR